jgi:Tfp pilus assembly protein PilF
MIVRNAETTLAACLESVKGLVDEMVIADTGSTDGTMDVARHFGARSLSIPWENDFARARNQALEEVQSDWVLVLDADEQLDEKTRQIVPRLLKPPAIDGYLATIRNYLFHVQDVQDGVWDFPAKPNRSRLESAKRFPAYVEQKNVRLFRRRPQFYFAGCVHESVRPQIVKTGGILGKANFLIHHFGLVVDGAVWARKRQLYWELGRKKVLEMPDNAQAHLELGLVEFHAWHNDEEALRGFRAALQLNPQMRTAWLYQGLALERLGRPSEALGALQRAKSIGGDSAPLAEGEGDAHFSLHDFESARACYRRALAYRRTLSLESKLGLAEVRTGRTRAGLKRLRQAVEKEPGRCAIHDRLIQAYVGLNLVEEAAAAADRKLVSIRPGVQSFLSTANLHAQLCHWEKAVEVLRAGLSRFPEAEKLRTCLTDLEPKIETKN